MISSRLAALRNRLPLAVELTVYFVVFGLVISHVTYVLLVIVQTRQLFTSVVEYVPTMRERTRSADIHDDGLKETVMELQRLIAQHEIATVTLLRRDTHGQWHTVERPGLPGYDGDTPVPDARYLEEALREGAARERSLFFGRGDELSLFVRPAPEAETERADHVLAVRIPREGIGSVFARSPGEIAIFTVLLALVSILLSRVFVRRVAGPITRLSHDALRVASGEKNHRFAIPGKNELARLGRALDTMTENLEGRLATVRRHAATLETMNRIDTAFLSSGRREDLVERVAAIVAESFPEYRVITYLKNDAEQTCEVLFDSHFGEVPTVPAALLEAAEPRVYFLNEAPFTPDLRRTFAPQTTRVLVAPLHADGVFHGSMVVADAGPAESAGGFPAEDRETLEAFAGRLAIAVQSLRQIEEKKAVLLGALQSLAAAIDAKSPWTAGHSGRVGAYALSLGRAVGLNEAEMEDLSVATTLHDIGKIAIDERILDKPARLTDEEYTLIKTHPVRGAAIVGTLPSSPAVRDGILYHHERWDGKGYPEGLSGTAIPLIGRVLCIADVYDAITADRPYRSGMAHEEALQFVRENRGVMFDPDLVDPFLAIVSGGGTDK